ncbi:protein farnesyltransferase/geranylgeranyltransferase type-1 subunit alpha [Nematocida displodere]|uniref:Protein farnesyltransferase/geranylgeranyltransferase type-1 subunit alpha n=1 Tax=Nematocida displodere TaxID=1805483 RepID=A0A177EFI9_9MICR|nr:protein farnesyltransferase/geranylgeranyltransferase type-1 subunit alpha [Nematocida displodere]
MVTGKETNNAPIRFKHSPEYFEILSVHQQYLQEPSDITEHLFAMTLLLEYNPANYTLWVQRRDRLPEAFSTTAYTPEDELTWLKGVVAKHQKCFQAWHHFKALLSFLSYNFLEDQEILSLVDAEPKNMHFWGFFVFAVKDTSHLGAALSFTEGFISKDVRNNSAFAARHAVLSRMLQAGAKPEHLLQEEKAFLLRLPHLTHNAAFWNYVSALSRAHPQAHLMKACCKSLRSVSLPKYHED